MSDIDLFYIHSIFQYSIAIYIYISLHEVIKSKIIDSNLRKYHLLVYAKRENMSIFLYNKNDQNNACGSEQRNVWWSFELDLLTLCLSSSIYCFERRYVKLEIFWSSSFSTLVSCNAHTWEETMLEYNVHAVGLVRRRL